MSWDAWVPQFSMLPVVWGGMFSEQGALCCSHVGEGGAKYAIDQTIFANIKKSIDNGDAGVKIDKGLMTIEVVKEDSLKCKSKEYCLIASKSKTVYIVVVTAGEDGKKPEKGFGIAENCAKLLKDSGC